MLKQRIITASLLIPLVVWMVLETPSSLFAGLTGIFVILAAWEWANLCGWQTWQPRLGYALSFGLLLWLLHQLAREILFILVSVACLWWLWALMWVGRYQFTSQISDSTNITKALQGILILLPAWGALYLLHQQTNGQQLVLLLFILIWVADSGAYLVGRKWGKTKLADKISPGKTWEGVIGGLFISVGLVWLYLSLTTQVLSISFMLLCGLTVMASILGDLVESLFKRHAGVKDSSQLLPGHGGILDRIDSLTAATPVFVVGIVVLGKPF